MRHLYGQDRCGTPTHQRGEDKDAGGNRGSRH
ncbi:hypothetical protein, partial [Bacteroides heparinolyticus]